MVLVSRLIGEWSDGRDTHYSDGSYRNDFVDFKLPAFLPGIALEMRIDDGTEAFDKEYSELFV